MLDSYLAFISLLIHTQLLQIWPGNLLLIVSVGSMDGQPFASTDLFILSTFQPVGSADFVEEMLSLSWELLLCFEYESEDK